MMEEIKAEMAANVPQVVARQGVGVVDGDMIVPLEPTKTGIPALTARLSWPGSRSARATSSRRAT
jgi:hypothetical protein